MRFLFKFDMAIGMLFDLKSNIAIWCGIWFKFNMRFDLSMIWWSGMAIWYAIDLNLIKEWHVELLDLNLEQIESIVSWNSEFVFLLLDRTNVFDYGWILFLI